MSNPAYFMGRVAPPKSVTVEYDCRGRREQKTFTDVFKARSFYTQKFKAGLNPRFVKPIA